MNYNSFPLVSDVLMIAEPDDQSCDDAEATSALQDLRIVASKEPVGNQCGERHMVRQLAARGILHLGIIDGRATVGGTVIGKHGEAMMVCFNQPTRILMAGNWKRFAPGTACLISSPVHIRTKPDTGWAVAYICYGDHSGFPELAGEPVDFNAAPLVQAIRGLQAEARAASEHEMLYHWVELIHGYVRIFAKPRQTDDRIIKAWSRISEDLCRDWSVEDMAVTAMMCSEHFRRLCLKCYGHSPMMHLSSLRVERAQHLLRTSDMKIDSICEEVGYEYRSTFSNIFTKLVGMRPSAYREATRGLSGGSLIGALA